MPKNVPTKREPRARPRWILDQPRYTAGAKHRSNDPHEEQITTYVYDGEPQLRFTIYSTPEGKEVAGPQRVNGYDLEYLGKSPNEKRGPSAERVTHSFVITYDLAEPRRVSVDLRLDERRKGKARGNLDVAFSPSVIREIRRRVKELSIPSIRNPFDRPVIRDFRRALGIMLDTKETYFPTAEVTYEKRKKYSCLWEYLIDKFRIGTAESRHGIGDGRQRRPCSEKFVLEPNPGGEMNLTIVAGMTRAYYAENGFDCRKNGFKRETTVEGGEDVRLHMTNQRSTIEGKLTKLEEGKVGIDIAVSKRKKPAR